MNSKTMGVINLTPNSFSDGKEDLSISMIKNRIQRCLADGHAILDFGAESTAPFNESVSESVEVARLEKYLIPIIDDLPENISISLDTYKWKTFIWAYNKIRAIRPTQTIIWNDISGKVHPHLCDFLNMDDNLSYVFSHNLAPTRELSAKHMDYFYEGEDFLDHIATHFATAMNLFNQQGVLNKVMFDPCFGFSKTREQNLYLIELMPEVIKAFPPSIVWVLGISKKSFLRTKEDNALAGEAKFANALAKEKVILTNWESAIQTEYIIRQHASM